MTKSPVPSQSPAPQQQLAFRSRLENIAAGMEYYALAVPAKITLALGTHGPVPVSARVNGSEPFLASLFPVGGGRHWLRVRNKVCKSVDIGAGDRVQVEITVRDRAAEVAIPKDLAGALRSAGLTRAFQALPIGKRSFMLRKLDEVVKPETRVKRIQVALQAAQSKSG